MKLFLDENLPPSLTPLLRDNNFDVESVYEAGLKGSMDSEISKYCIENNRTIITLDYDFSNLFKFPLNDSPGIIRLKLKYLNKEYIHEHILKCLKYLMNTPLQNKLIVYSEDRIRIRE